MKLGQYDIFISEYAQNGGVIKTAAIKAGFSPMYADRQGKRILNTALRIQAKKILGKADKMEVDALGGKKMMHDMLGLSSEQVFTTLKKISQQDKDYSSALKVLTPLSKELGVDISSQDQQNITVPILNIGITKQDTPDNDLVEPDTTQ